MQNMHSSVWRSNTGCESFTTIAIMEGSPTKRLWMMSGRHIKQSHTAVSVYITKRGCQKMHSGHHRKRLHLPPACRSSMAQSHSCQLMATSHQATAHFRPQTPTGNVSSSVWHGHPTGPPRPVPASLRCPCHRGRRSS